MDELVSCILNDAFMVRHYERNQIRRLQSIQKLGETLRFAFNRAQEPQEYETLISTLLDAFRPRDRRPF